jgi:signal transduction histidine kinase
MRSIFLFLLCLPLFCLSQAVFTNTDSMLQRLAIEQNDTLKARLYIRIANSLSQSEPDKALSYQKQGLALVKKMKWRKGLAAFYNDIGSIYLNQSQFKEALENFKLSTQYSDSLPYLKAVALQNMSIIYFNQTDIPLTMLYADSALSIANKEGINAVKINCNITYGNVYKYKKDNANAKLFYERALTLSQTEKQLTSQAEILTNLGDISNDLPSSILYYEQSKRIWDSINPTFVLAISNLFGLTEAQLRLIRSDSLRKINAPRKNKAELISETEKYIQDAIAYSKEGKYQQNLMYAYGKMSELKELQGDYKAALQYINLNYEIYTTIFSQENQNKIANIEGKQKLLEKENEIAIKKIVIAQNERQKWFFVVGLILLFFIGVLLYYQNRQRKKVNQYLLKLNAELDQANQTKNLFFSILNHDLRSPVSNIIDLLQMQNDSPELIDEQTGKRLNQNVLHGAENLLNTMEDLLLWSKGQMEHFKPVPTHVDIKDLYSDTQNYFSDFRHFQLEIIDPELNSIITDINYLKTILRNLINNSIHALRSIESPYILWTLGKNEQCIYLRIRDNAGGISKSHLNPLTNKDADIGIKNGLGLHLVRDLAKAIDCEIEVAIEEGVGTSFTLMFNRSSIQ